MKLFVESPEGKTFTLHIAGRVNALRTYKSYIKRGYIVTLSTEVGRGSGR